MALLKDTQRGRCREDGNYVPCEKHGYGFVVFPGEKHYMEAVRLNPPMIQVNLPNPEVQFDKFDGTKHSIKAPGQYTVSTRDVPWTNPVPEEYEDVQVKEQSDFPTLRSLINDFTTNFYGPRPCDGCGRHNVVRSEMGSGRAVTSWEEYEVAHGTNYTPHHCTHTILFKKLAGEVLTVIDASLVTNPTQHKAVCDLLRKAFRKTIDHARTLEGDTSSECVSGGKLA